MPNSNCKKAMLKCPLNYKKEFKDSKCSITISVGQPIHENEKFKATIEAVNSSFKECTIMVCDSLQRHTLKVNLVDQDIHQKANDLGEKWLERNSTIIKQLNIKYNITRWDYWLYHPQYQDYRKQIDQLFITDQIFKATVENTALLFLARNLKKMDVSAVSKKDILQSSYNYLKEECAVMLIWAKYQYHFELYPSPRNLAMKYIYQTIISKNNPNLVREVLVKYKNSSLIK